MTLPLPWTLSKDDPAGPDLEDRVQENFDKLAQAVVDTGGRALRVRAGSGTLTWPGGAVASNTLAVSHGLGGTPVSVVVSGGANSGVTLFPVVAAYSPTSTQFTVQANTVDGSNPLNTATTTFYWVAIG